MLTGLVATTSASASGTTTSPLLIVKSRPLSAGAEVACTRTLSMTALSFLPDGAAVELEVAASVDDVAFSLSGTSDLGPPAAGSSSQGNGGETYDHTPMTDGQLGLHGVTISRSTVSDMSYQWRTL